MRCVFIPAAVFAIASGLIGCAEAPIGCPSNQVANENGDCVFPCELTDCSDGTDCTDDVCTDLDDGTADCSNPSKEVDASCNSDGGSVCDGEGNCVECNSASQCTEDDNECTRAVCESNQCSQGAVDDGNSCDFGDAAGICMAGECTDAGICEGKECDDEIECTDNLCDPKTGMCSNPVSADGTDCDAAGQPGRCEEGACKGLCEGVICDDENECTNDGVCNPSTGNCEGPSSRPDGTPCSLGACLDGECGNVFPCSEQAIRDAINKGGGPFLFDCPPGTEIAIAAEIVLNQDVTLDGEGKLALSGSGARRVFVVPPGGTSAELRGFIIRNGHAPSGFPGGGGILNNQSNLVLRDVQLTGNVAVNDGGGIDNYYGDLRMVNCDVRLNGAYRGAGISNTGQLSISKTTIVDNTATLEGGAIATQSSGEMTVEQSTLAGNAAGVGGTKGFGGALLIKGETLLLNSTLVNNSAHIGGALWSNTTTKLVQVTMAENHTWTSTSGDISGAGNFQLQGTAIDGDCDDAGTWSSRFSLKTTATNCGSGTTQVPDLRLLPIADNGGATWTLYPETGSPTIDIIPEVSCTDDYAAGTLLTRDQRDLPRPQGASRECDVGAVEFDQ